MIKLELTNDVTAKVIAELTICPSVIEYDDIHDIEKVVINKISEITKIPAEDIDVNIDKKYVYIKSNKYYIDAVYDDILINDICITYKIIQRNYTFDWLEIN